MQKLSRRAEQEVQFALVEASRNLTVRNWLEVKRMLLDYILKSPEKPLGEILKIFCRDEYQGDTGNLCHMHLLVTLARGYSDDVGKKLVEKLIRGFVQDIVTEEEIDNYVTEGIFKNRNEIFDMQDQARAFLPHHHSSRCMRRTGTGPNDLQCRVPDTRYISNNLTSFYEAQLRIHHSKEATDIMRRIGLVTLNEHNEIVPQRNYLKSTRIYAPARHGEGNITPVIGRLFAATRSTMNVQICTSHGTSRYVVKYVVKVDKNNYVAFSCKQGEPGLKAEHVFLHNTKVSSSAKNEAKKLNESKHKTQPRGRAVAATEMMQIILGNPQVYCNMEFMKIPTVPLGERPGFERTAPSDIFDDLLTKEKVSANTDAFDFMVPIVRYREEHFPNA
jgi:hypothetical protein